MSSLGLSSLATACPLAVQLLSLPPLLLFFKIPTYPVLPESCAILPTRILSLFPTPQLLLLSTFFSYASHLPWLMLSPNSYLNLSLVSDSPLSTVLHPSAFESGCFLLPLLCAGWVPSQGSIESTSPGETVSYSQFPCHTLQKLGGSITGKSFSAFADPRQKPAVSGGGQNGGGGWQMCSPVSTY